VAGWIKAGLWGFDVFIMVPCFFVSGECLSGPAFLRCISCGGLNPVYSEVKPGEEHICVFCGFLFNAPAETVEVLGTRKPERRKRQRQREAKPENRNMRKPLL